MRSSFNNPYFLSIYGKRERELSKDIALAQASIKGSIDKIDFEISCGWFGVPEEVKKFLKEKFENLLSRALVSNFLNFGSEKIIDEELRLFVLEVQEKNRNIELIGDMKNFQFFVKENGRLRKMPLVKLEQDQIYRIFKKFVDHSLNLSQFPIKKHYIDFIMDVIFEAREKIFEKTKNSDESELNKSLEIVKSRLIT